MKKKGLVYGALGVLIVALLVLPGILGGQIETRVRGIPDQKLVQDFERLYGFEIEITDYQKGWFASEVTFEATLPAVYQNLLGQGDSGVETPIPPLVYKIPIKHGPVLFGSDGISFGAALMEGDFHFLGENADEISETRAAFPKIHSSTRFDFGGGQYSRTSLPEGSWEMEGPNGENINFFWDEIIATGETDFQAQIATGSFSMPRFVMATPEQGTGGRMEVILENLAGELDYDLSQPAPMFTAEGWVAMDSLKMDITDPLGQKSAFSMGGFREDISLIRHQDPDIVGYNVPIKVSAVAITRDGETKTYLKSLDMVLIVDNVSQKNILGYYEKYFGSLSAMRTLDRENTEAVTQEFLKAYLILLGTSIRFDIPKAYAETIKGTLSYSHTLSLPAVPDPETFIFPAWVQGIEYAGAFIMSQDFVTYLVDQTLESQLGPSFLTLDPETLDTLRQNTILQLVMAGYLADNGDGTFSADLAFREGALTVNGNAFDLTPFLGATGQGS